MFCIENILVTRGNNTLFQGVGLTLFPGSLLVVQGDNGCGKSSFLLALAGLLQTGEGRAGWREKGADFEEEYIFRQRMLYIGHQNAIKPELTVVENIRYWASLFDSDLLVPAAISYFGLEDYAHTRCGKLSAGWQRRVALARLVAIPSSIWLLDEPMSNLDEKGQGLLERLIATRCNQGGIVLMASHDVSTITGASYFYIRDFAP